MLYRQTLMWLDTHFWRVFWVIELVSPFLREKSKNLKKGLYTALHPEMLFQTKKKFKYIDRARIEKSWTENELFLTLVWFISLSNIRVLSWKFYRSLLTSAPTYAPNFSPFERTWAEIDFWGIALTILLILSTYE